MYLESLAWRGGAESRLHSGAGVCCVWTAESSVMEPDQDVESNANAELADLLDAGNGAVVSLVVGETQLVVHRAVVAARSPVLAAILRHSSLEASSNEITITDVEAPVLRQLLAYCYTQRAPQLPSMAAQLLAAADMYGVAELKVECEQQLAAQLAVETAAATAILALRHSCPTLTVRTVAFIKAHNFQVMATQGWADAVLNCPKEVVNLCCWLNKPLIETSLSRGEMNRMLILAAMVGAELEVWSLLAAGADVGTKDGERGASALHWAAHGGHVRAATRLLEGGAEVDARERCQATPLVWAAGTGRVDVVRLLLAHSADPNARVDGGLTPLHFAVYRGHTEVTKALLEAGADWSARAVNGITPLDLARLRVHQKLRGMLHETSSPTNCGEPQ